MIGMRLIKSGLAVVVAALIAQYFNLSTPFFICMTAFISMEKTLLTSLALGRNRVVGTAIGAIVGGMLSIYFPGNPIAAGIGVMLAIKICTLLNLHGAIFISGIVCLACTLHVSNGRGVDYAIARTFESFLGMLVSIGINIIFFPYYNIERLKTIEKDLLTAIKTNDEVNITKNMNLLKNNIDLYKNEFISTKKRTTLQQHLSNYDYFEKIKQHLNIQQLINNDEIKQFHQNEISNYLSEIKI